MISKRQTLIAIIDGLRRAEGEYFDNLKIEDMENDKFQVLTAGWINDHFVNENMLSKGIYFTDKPTLYLPDETIESLVIKAHETAKFVPHLIDKTYIENLQTCTLKPCRLVL